MVLHGYFLRTPDFIQFGLFQVLGVRAFRLTAHASSLCIDKLVVCHGYRWTTARVGLVPRLNAACLDTIQSNIAWVHDRDALFDGDFAG